MRTIIMLCLMACNETTTAEVETTVEAEATVVSTPPTTATTSATTEIMKVSDVATNTGNTSVVDNSKTLKKTTATNTEATSEKSDILIVEENNTQQGN